MTTVRNTTGTQAIGIPGAVAGDGAAKSRLLTAAVLLFGEKGYAGVGIR